MMCAPFCLDSLETKGQYMISQKSIRAGGSGKPQHEAQTSCMTSPHACVKIQGHKKKYDFHLLKCNLNTNLLKYNLNTKAMITFYDVYHFLYLSQNGNL